ncbi:putative uncharacterized protein [Aliivibrio wodanis]|uniref:Cytoplasmic protein n=1 Tax=Aliivibrio wodanis TaxID=80852 RepID=A0A090I9Q6_9GAMM|nr:putative uncharacterized protein [Aliivibrio wodanis]VVV05973.1 hypothetical protein AW0309160_03457 [Aliivibrio wodanis]
MIWNITELTKALSKDPLWDVKENDNTILITNNDGVEAFLAISGEQILVEIILFSEESVSDIAGLNAFILKTHKLFPLSTIGINQIDQGNYYVAFGALSSHSVEESIHIEITTLFNNVEGFLDIYQSYLKEI